MLLNQVGSQAFMPYTQNWPTKQTVQMALVPTMNFFEKSTFGVVFSGRGGMMIAFGSLLVEVPTDFFSNSARTSMAFSVCPVLAYQCAVSRMANARKIAYRTGMPPIR